MRTLLLSLLLLPYFAAELCAQHLLHTEAEIQPSATLIQLDDKLNWQFATASGLRTLASNQIVRWGAWGGVTRGSAVWLRDGSWLVGDLQVTTPETVILTSAWFQQINIPIRMIRGVVRVAPPSIAAWNRLQRQLESTTGGRDMVWLSAGRQVAGIVRIAPDANGVTSFILENAGQMISVDWQEVQALAFSPALLGPIPALTTELVMALVDGSKLNIRSMDTVAARVKLTLACGIELLSLDMPDEFSSAVNMLMNRSERSSFIASLEPASYRNISHTRIEWPLGRNRDLHDRPLMNLNGIVDRGLAMHSSSQAAYRWDGSRARLLAEVTLAKPPEEADQDVGSVLCQVLLARDGKLETAVSVTLDRNTAEPVLLDIDLTGAQLIALVTERGDLGPYGDHLLWIDARIAK